ncbi:hypothetical protein [Leadbettera azotonutricia]|uniref:WD40 repeat domain-containing protein n=1 Tax=Leadbettera azotonutricia (strain ATCC BAA-888 / DSM 13862 / ZAS-9) TaxID=545695 RepID=F5Y9I4_LEAAZ|nr:hypothetical protein [Leadbettera azotonutricia]AEF81076.1 hypothetical protein TREAZ_0855 [Leadbettera azotonutricia ZAS-9]
MAKETKKYWLILAAAVFFVYVFAAAQPIPVETILVSRWLTSLESNYPLNMGGSPPEAAQPLAFELGGRFGYVGDDGRFAINRLRKGYVSLSEDHWAEYDALPQGLQIMDPQDNMVLEIENPKGYPVFLDKKLFIIGAEQNSITALDSRGNELWTYDFPAPLTCIDAAAGFILVGTLDGTVELLNASGTQACLPFEPGGSRLSVILGCAISADASRLAIVSGIDDQRFLLLEQSGDTYHVVYHEFLTDGFRRAVYMAFIDSDNRVAFEREGGIGIYDILSRSSVNIPLDGEIAAIDGSGGDRLLFVVTSQSAVQKKLTAIRFPGTIIMEAPFKSKAAFLGRRGSKIYVGGDMSLASFELGKK